MKNIIGIYTSPRAHWVGDGFPVRTLFSYDNLGQHISPFLLLDHAAPTEFSPTTERRGVGQHPHRGFETVTIVYQGELEHRDSTGSGGIIGAGDVQWMTAAKGILHEEFHSQGFAQRGGTLEMVQLWVNLPARDKMAAPGYQTLIDGDIPLISLPDDAGNLRLIAGEFAGQQGPARTFTPIDVWDIRLNAGKPLTLDLPAGRNTALVVLHGTVQVNGQELAREGQLVLFERDGQQLSLEANNDAVVLLLSGEPIDEPIVGHGPFVMNSEQEIHQAFIDFQSGGFGRMDAAH
ncbi:pirin family protein [Pseudomonas sp. TH05]|uniref:pirin family protein n=1 Tax=unclassified Pseudomonas TaxID=196821 RepID=UPI000997D91C|nr:MULTISPECIES: pirin family protein [unclassified Pseudomonas]MBK5542582.1 pirin family protein [Pseudomonas sp. TH07]MBK5559460.1 pirin family protein [Pseudomonas sp. TH05]OOV89455.1 quercetin 2,3-dioxygenase [Pseudomonas sp. MF4836]